MYLKSLTINGFKSFAKKGELEFSTPITAIVGPNGSGKSNVAEAFRFVLGEQSIKSMRGKKGEDLIFNGSESISRMNRASVAITLQNAEINGRRVFPLDFDEITIERVVNRDGTNEYLINNGKTRLKDVQELLAAANIGPTGHHIISQGEADRILSASPRERREMIEDALGLKVFQFKKAESERKLKKTQENIAQVESLRREVAPHLKFLERQVKKIERSIELQNELKTVYAEYLRREDTYIAHHYDRLTAERQVPLVRLETLKRELESAKVILASREKDEKREALIHLEGSMSTVRAKRQELTRAIGQLEGQILYLGRRIEDAKKKALTQEGMPISFTTLKTTTDDIETGVESAVQSNDTKVLVRMLRDVVNTLRMLLKHAEKKSDEVEGKDDVQEHEALLSEKRARDEELLRVNQEEEKYRAVYENLKNAIDNDASRTRETEHQMFALMQEEREVSGTLDHIDREIAHLERDRDEFKRELQEAVSLLGRGAALYYEFVVKDDAGHEVTRDTMVSEGRTVQIERRRNLERMKIRLEELGQGANDDVLKEYKDVKERDEFLVREVGDLTESVAKLEELIKDLTDKLNEQFVTGIEKIGTEFNKFFILMFGGGSALLNRVKPKAARRDTDELLLEGEIEPEEAEVEEGIELEVKLPNKKVSGLDMLSGGERALTSIALIFAMSQVNPPLFVILDETDAALDEANSRRYGDMISALAEKSPTYFDNTQSRDNGTRWRALWSHHGRGRSIKTPLSQIRRSCCGGKIKTR